MAENSNDEFLDYLKNDLTATKIQNQLLRRQSSNWVAVCLALTFTLLISCGIFAGAIYFITAEQTRQIQEIFDATWEVSTTVEKEKVTTDRAEAIADDNGPANAAVNKAEGASTINNSQSYKE